MIDEILTKAREGKELSDDEFLELLNIDDDEDLEKLFKVACDIRDSQSKVIKLTSVRFNPDANTADLQKRPLKKDITMHFTNPMMKY